MLAIWALLLLLLGPAARVLANMEGAWPWGSICGWGF
jgi:hypothetical protein